VPAAVRFGVNGVGGSNVHPRVKNALGLVPTVNKLGVFGSQFDPLASGLLTPVTYHGGQVMTGGVTLHAIFWDGNGAQPFEGSPGSGIRDYEGMIEQFFTDVAAGSTGTSGQGCTTAHCNDFTVEPQFGQEGAGTGQRDWWRWRRGTCGRPGVWSGRRPLQAASHVLIGLCWRLR
jgi:hypothetical protein